MAVVSAKVKYAFTAADDNQLSLLPGVIVKVHSQSNADWWDAEYNGARGYAPASYLEIIPEPKKVTPPPPPSKVAAKIAAPAKSGGARVKTAETRDVLGLGLPAQSTSPSSSASSASASANLGASGLGPKGNAAKARNQQLKERLLGDDDSADSSSSSSSGPAERAIFSDSKRPLMLETKVETPTAGGRGEAGAKGEAAALKAATSDVRLPAGKFYNLAENMATASALTMVIMGITSMITGSIGFGVYDVLVGLYSIAFGILMYLYEKRVKSTSRDLGCFRTSFPVHAIIYLVCSGPFIFSKSTYLCCMFLVVQAAVNLISAILEEMKTVREIGAEYKKPSKGDGDDDEKEETVWEKIKNWYFQMQAENHLRLSVFVVLYTVSNVLIFFVVLKTWMGIVAAQPAEKRLSWMAPYAKAFGNVLDFNCVIVLMPVCRTFLRLLYNRSTRDKLCFSRFLSFILSFTPIDHNIGAHRTIAQVVVIGSFGHTVAHMINLAMRHDVTVATFGYWAFISGGLIFLIMFVMYSAAAENVKRGHYELFWYVHHLFIFFYVLLVTHGRGGFNGNFWKWLVLPGLVYIMERIARVVRARMAVALVSVTHMRSKGTTVLCLELSSEMFKYAEGQYLFLNCPAISRQQWHPFTISSAPQEETLTLHIRVMGEGSWTRRLADHLEAMGPAGATHYTFSRMENGTARAGKITGPDGTVLFRADGPHSAPTQHVSDYSAVMIAGAGIGVTPLAATLKSIVFHRWKYFIGKSFPDHAHFVWSCSWSEVDTFRWLVRIIKDVQDALVDMRQKSADSMSKKTFDFHIYITSVPKDVDSRPIEIDPTPQFWGIKNEAESSLERKSANFTREDLYRAMKRPTKAPQQLGDITIWSGRPDWDARFTALAKQHDKEDIGVLFCGNAFIGADLQAACSRYSMPQAGGPMFKLHKENF